MALDDPRPSTTAPLVLGVDAQGVTVVLSLTDLADHGLICGVTGSGKTHTAKVLAEGLSALGVPVLAVDAKGDFAGISQARSDAPPTRSGDETAPRAPPPVIPWDLAGQRGHRLTFPIPAGGPPHLGRTQLSHLRDDGAAFVGVLDAAGLISTPAAYAAAVRDLIVHLAESHAALLAPADTLRMMVLIEEAHLVFRHTDPKGRKAIARALTRLAARHVALVFVTSEPSDLPDLVDAALGFRIQHSLWTPSDVSQVRLQTWFGLDRETSASEVRDTVRTLGIGEALVAGARNRPTRRVQITRSATRDGPIRDGERRKLIAATSATVSPHAGVSPETGARRTRSGLRSHGRRLWTDRSSP